MLIILFLTHFYVFNFNIFFNSGRFKRETLAVEEPLLAERNREKENATIWLFDELFRDYDQRIRPYFASKHTGVLAITK